MRQAASRRVGLAVVTTVLVLKLAFAGAVLGWL